MAEPKFNNKDGSLTAYSFACGYIEQKIVGTRRVQLYRDGIYQVRGHCDVDGRLFWESFENLTAARKFFAVSKTNYLI